MTEQLHQLERTYDATALAVAYDCGSRQGEEYGAHKERDKITKWLRSLDQVGGDINRFLPTTLANWIEERMHEL